MNAQLKRWAQAGTRRFLAFRANNFRLCELGSIEGVQIDRFHRVHQHRLESVEEAKEQSLELSCDV